MGDHVEKLMCVGRAFRLLVRNLASVTATQRVKWCEIHRFRSLKTTVTTSENLSNTLPTILTLDSSCVSLIEEHGLTVKRLKFLGFEIYGADVRSKLPEPVIKALAVKMVNRVFVVFKHQTNLSADELISASKW